MSLTSQQKKALRAIGHKLKPVVMISGNGLSNTVQAEIGRALLDHELIKLKLMSDNRAARAEWLDEICRYHDAELVQTIGKTALLYKEAVIPRATSTVRQ